MASGYSGGNPGDLTVSSQQEKQEFTIARARYSRTVFLHVPGTRRSQAHVRSYLNPNTNTNSAHLTPLCGFPLVSKCCPLAVRTLGGDVR